MGRISLEINGNDKESDLRAVWLLHWVHLLKLYYLLDDYKKIETAKSAKFAKYEVKEIGGETVFGTSKIGEDLMRKQAYAEAILFQGVSLFEKICKDWFQMGLIYCPNRMNHFKEREIKLGDILGDQNFKLKISELIINKIKFEEPKESEKYFKKVFGVSLLKDTKSLKKIEKIIKHRHIIAHNSGLTDKKFCIEQNINLEDLNNMVDIPLRDLNYFLRFLNGTIGLLSKEIRKTINEDLNKNSNNEGNNRTKKRTNLNKRFN